MKPNVHPTAIVHPEAKIDPTTEVGPYCIVGQGTKLGPANKLISHVVIENRVTVGEGNVFSPFCVIGGVPQDLKYKGEDTEVIIGNKNSIREYVTINIGTAGGGGATRVGNGNLLMAYVHLGHDVQLANNTVIGNSCQIAGHAVIEDYAILGGLSGVSQFIRVGAHCYIGGCSGVDRDMPPYAMGFGPNSNFTVLGMNLVGLKRRGFSSESISALQEVKKIFFEDKSTEKELALRKIESVVPRLPEVEYFVKFVRASQKGIQR